MVAHCQKQPSALMGPCEGLWNFTWWKRRESRVGKNMKTETETIITFGHSVAKFSYISIH